jgi:hypothetical protein
MISKDVLSAVRMIVTHDHCSDGLASALILRDVLPAARIVFVQHDTPGLLALPAEQGMIFCDMSPTASRADEFVAAGAVVLDHHRTARAVVEAFGPRGVFADENAEPGVSGATLAYREVWRQLAEGSPASARAHAISELATLAGIRDTWRRASPRWDEACAQHEALTFWPRDTWLATPAGAFASMLAIGPTLLAKKAERVKQALDVAFRHTHEGVRLVLLSGVELTSDAAEAVDHDADLVAGFAYRAEPDGSLKLTFSLRSHTDLDCAAFAKREGGGGHTRAAGFTVRVDPFAGQPPHATLVQRLDAYLRAR